MAKIINTSQAWQSIVTRLAFRNISAENPESISKLLNIKQEEYKSLKINAAAKVDAKIQNLINELEVNKKDFQEKFLVANELTTLRMKKSQAIIQLLQKEKGLFRMLVNIFKIRKLRSKIRNQINKRKRYGAFLKGKLTINENDLKTSQEKRNQLIEQECEMIKADIVVLEQALHSPELKGAIAELGLIENLSKLPDDFIIINDVNLSSNKAIYFDGEWLLSAQIDHIVISPAGVFVIEAKNWSKSFSESGDFFDPYQQVKRSSYLCRKFLYTRLKGAMVRSIIAHNGNIPKKPDESYAKVLRFHEVYEYIHAFKNKILTREDIINIANQINHASQEQKWTLI